MEDRMPRITITLDDADYHDVAQLAEQDHRTLPATCALLVRAALDQAACNHPDTETCIVCGEDRS